MKQLNEVTDKIFERITEIVNTTASTTLTWEELLNETTDEEEEAILRELTRYVASLKFSPNKFEALKNPNLFSIEDMVFVGGLLESYYICYNDVEIIYLSRPITVGEVQVSNESGGISYPTYTATSKQKISWRNSI